MPGHHAQPLFRYTSYSASQSFTSSSIIVLSTHGPAFDFLTAFRHIAVIGGTKSLDGLLSGIYARVAAWWLCHLPHQLIRRRHVPFLTASMDRRTTLTWFAYCLGDAIGRGSPALAMARLLSIPSLGFDEHAGSALTISQANECGERCRGNDTDVELILTTSIFKLFFLSADDLLHMERHDIANKFCNGHGPCNQIIASTSYTIMQVVGRLFRPLPSGTA